MADTFGDFTFDGPNKRITCGNGVVSFSAGEVYSRWKQWTADGDHAKYVEAFGGSVGGESLGGGVYVGSYYFIKNGWVIRPHEANHTLVVSGNLYPVPDTASIFTSTVGSYTILVSMRTSSLTQQVVSSTGGASAADVADAVWGEDISTYGSGTAGKVVTDTGNNAGIIPGLL